MLNISYKQIPDSFIEKDLKSLKQLNLSSANKMFTRWLIATMVILLVFMFLPWTQNIQSEGKVTTLKPNQRPQTIPTAIAGRIEQWYVQEGQLVNKGDTIVFISEIKDAYFDPQLVQRTQNQVNAKESAMRAYTSKISALEEQISNLRFELEFKQEQLKNKIQQAKFKIQSDSIELKRARIDYDIALRQLIRVENLEEKGITSTLDVEGKKLKVQETNAKRGAALNKFQTSKNELINATLDLQTIVNNYNQKIAKAQSEKFSTLSQLYDADADANKLRIQTSNYERRQSFYYILAPQDCYITKVMKPGLGETVKEGDPIVSIMPANYELAVELYIKPMDLPLVDIGNEVRFIFDGWPAFIFSGWPDQSFGTYKGTVVGIDNNISKNGRYRILISADETEKEWPKALRVGSAAQGIALLNNVPLWYEIWRKLNGFPPDYYQENTEELPKLKAPAKSIPK